MDQYQVFDQRHGCDHPDFTDCGADIHYPGSFGRSAGAVLTALVAHLQPDLCGVCPRNPVASNAVLGVLRTTIFKSMGLNIPIDPFWGAIITLAISDSAFTAEIYRAGIQSIPKGQTEAAQTVGLSYAQSMRYVILPQAVRLILPPLANQFIYIVKMSAFASVIGMQELTRRANELVVSEYRPLEIYSLLIVEYLVLVLIISAGVRWLERRMRTGDHR